MNEHAKHACPCCGHLTLTSPSDYEVCPVCYWEDDGQGDDDEETVRGGPNGALSLRQARENFKTFGACDERFLPYVRSVNLGE